MDLKDWTRKASNTSLSSLNLLSKHGKHERFMIFDDMVSRVQIFKFRILVYESTMSIRNFWQWKLTFLPSKIEFRLQLRTIMVPKTKQKAKQQNLIQQALAWVCLVRCRHFCNRTFFGLARDRVCFESFSNLKNTLHSITGTESSFIQEGCQNFG